MVAQRQQRVKPASSFDMYLGKLPLLTPVYTHRTLLRLRHGMLSLLKSI